MMLLFVNDASLQGQFPDNQTFRNAFLTVMRIRSLRTLRDRIRSVRMLPNARVTASSTLREAIIDAVDKDVIRLTLIWLDKTGPFVDDERLEEENDYFEYENLDVTDSALGEAARRVKTNFECATFSFEGGESNFAHTSLLVDHGLPEERYGRYRVSNYWSYDQIESLAETLQPSADSWRSLIKICTEKFPNIHFSPEIVKVSGISKLPFEASVATAVLRLLDILDKYVRTAIELGPDCSQCKQIVSDYFTGARAIFSPESTTNKSKYKDKLTFCDPDDANRNIFAHWHGKVSHRVFRIHFEWPIPNGQDYVKVLYIGPKITTD